jgi:hypothetical protein
VLLSPRRNLQVSADGEEDLLVCVPVVEAVVVFVFEGSAFFSETGGHGMADEGVLSGRSATVQEMLMMVRIWNTNVTLSLLCYAGAHCKMDLSKRIIY